jgi:hypothetical protein
MDVPDSDSTQPSSITSISNSETPEITPPEVSSTKPKKKRHNRQKYKPEQRLQALAISRQRKEDQQPSEAGLSTVAVEKTRKLQARMINEKRKAERTAIRRAAVDELRENVLAVSLARSEAVGRRRIAVLRKREEKAEERAAERWIRMVIAQQIARQEQRKRQNACLEKIMKERERERKILKLRMDRENQRKRTQKAIADFLLQKV